MRLTSWNGSPGADPTRCLTLLDPLRPDVVTLQECRRPSRLDRTVVWHGPTEKQGVAVARRTSDLRVEPLTIPGLHPTVLPVLVSGPSPFLLVGVWTHPPYHPVAYASMKACVGVAARLPLVAAGDFNSSPRVSGQARTSPEFMKRMREEFGLVNAYHSHFDEALGEETRPTYYHQWKEAAPFHLDYCFLPETWAPHIRAVEVGTFGEWPSSDHRPLTVEIDM